MGGGQGHFPVETSNVVQRHIIWFLRKGRGFLRASFGSLIRLLRFRVLVRIPADAASLASCFPFGKLFCVAITFCFGEKRCRKKLPLCDLPKSMAKLPDWIIDELTRFATGERGWNQWGQWLAVSAARLAQEMPRDAFSQLKANPETEVIRQVAASGVAIVPHSHPVLVSHTLDNNTHFQSVMGMASELAETELGDSASEMGSCHQFWSAKKRILKTQFGLEWQTPAELNPDVCFD